MIAQNIVITLSLASPLVSGAVKCGEKTCDVFEYCSENVFCNRCVDICLISSHNYDDYTCKTNCADYLNSLYVTREDLEAAVSRVYTYVVVSLAISILVLLLVLSAFFAIWLKYQKMRCYDDKFKKKLESIKTVCISEVDGSKKLKLQMPEPAQDKDTLPSALTTMTPLSTRHPAEDATLEYAYDNPTLTHSPEFGKNQAHITPDTTPKTSRTETSF